MKKNFLKIMSVCLLLAGFWSCKKDEKQIIFEGGAAPVLTQLSANPDSVLLRVNRNNEFVNISWTNPEYRFTTGTSSQDVTYTLQIDTVGANFTNPKKQEVSISKDLSRIITVGDMNNYLTKMELTIDTAHNIEMRVVSNLNGAIKLYSNVISFTQVVMYEDFAIPPPATNQLFIVGDGTATGWDNNPGVPHFATKVSKGLYIDTVHLESGKYYKYLSSPGNWQPQYGLKKSSGGTSSGGDLGLNNQTPLFPSDPDAIPTLGTGEYIVTLNFTTGKYSVVPK